MNLRTSGQVDILEWGGLKGVEFKRKQLEKTIFERWRIEGNRNTTNFKMQKCAAERIWLNSTKEY